MSTHTFFYCEHCQNAVNINTDICPYCGALFSGVRCPSCNYSGTSSDFTNGCPECGYVVSESKAHKKKSSLQPVVFTVIIVTFLIAAVVLSIWYKSML